MGTRSDDQQNLVDGTGLNKPACALVDSPDLFQANSDFCADSRPDFSPIAPISAPVYS